MSAVRRFPAFPLPVTPDDLVRHALAAYYRAAADSTPPIEYPEPEVWSDPDEFVRMLCDFFELRLRCEAAKAGHQVDADPDRFALWSGSLPYRDQHYRDVDPDDWAQISGTASANLGVQGAEPSAGEGHGCPASAAGAPPPPSAVGTAPTAPPDGYITCNTDPLLAVSGLQELPEVNPRDNLDANRESTA